MGFLRAPWRKKNIHLVRFTGLPVRWASRVPSVATDGTCHNQKTPRTNNASITQHRKTLHQSNLHGYTVLALFLSVCLIHKQHSIACMMKCSVCGVEMLDGEPHCPTCESHPSMTCNEAACDCTECSTKVASEEAVCDECGGVAAL